MSRSIPSLPPNRPIPPWICRFTGTQPWFAVLLATLPTLGSTAESADWQVSKRTEQWPLAPATEVIAIENPIGDIRIRRGLPGRIELVAVTQGVGDVSQHPSWTVRESRQRWRLVVSGNETVSTNARADLALLVPSDLRLELRTRQGRIDVRQQHAPIYARSDSGTLMVTSTVALDVQSESGAIIAALMNQQATTASSLRSRSGAIDLALNQHARWTLRVRACAGIEGLPSVSQGHCHQAAETARGSPVLSVRTEGRFSLVRTPAAP